MVQGRSSVNAETLSSVEREDGAAEWVEAAAKSKSDVSKQFAESGEDDASTACTLHVVGVVRIRFGHTHLERVPALHVGSLEAIPLQSDAT